MAGTLRLAWRYFVYFRARTAILIAAITLTAFLPLATHWTIQRFEHRALQRASATPLVVGVKSSRFGLAMHALYFRGETPQTLPVSELSRIEESSLATSIPLFARFRAQGFTIVGTSDAYFSFRQLSVEYGGPLERIGDCLLGAKVAADLQLKPGDRLLSDPENMFDLSGPAPLNMRVTGILKPTRSPEDEFVLCDLKTTWIMQGIGHGHAMQSELAKGSGSTTDTTSHGHNASREHLQQDAEVTDENLPTFHFHGPTDSFPLTAIIAIPHSEKSETLLIGKYLTAAEPYQIIRPVEVVDELMQLISQVRQLLDWIALALAVSTSLLIGLVLMLSIRLRAREIRTLTLLGCSRLAIVKLVFTELTLVITVSFALAIALAVVASHSSDRLITRLF